MKPQTLRLLLLVLVSPLVTALATTPAAAIVAVERDFPDLVARAEQIVVGTVIDIHEDTTEDKH